MAIATANDLTSRRVGGRDPVIFDMPVDGGTRIYRNTLLAQLTATGQVVPYSTASSEGCIGIAEHEADNTGGADGAKRVRVASLCIVALKNGAGGDEFADTDLIGRLVYATDDTTAAKTSGTQTRKPIGFYLGREATDGYVRVYLDPSLAFVVEALQTLTDAPGTADALRDNIVASFG